METIFQDIRYGARMLIRNPGFTLIAVITLALGVGANTSIFGLVNALLLKPLPYQDSDRLVVAYSRTQNEPRGEVSYADLKDWREQNQSFSHLSAFTTQSVNLTGRAEPGRLIGGFVSADFFKLLAVDAAVGRSFTSKEDLPGAERVAIVNHLVWRDRFGSDPALIGQALILNGQSYTVIGVMPQGFRSPYSDVDVWTPIQNYPGFSIDRKSGFVGVIGRLKDGATIKSAQADLESIAGRLSRQYPDSNRDRGVAVFILQDLLVEGIRPSLLTLFRVVICVLLIACANVANLQLARATSRTQEFALRSALGASRWRITRQILTESLMLALMGAVLGSLIGWWGIDALRTEKSLNLLPNVVVDFDLVVFAFTMGATLLTGLIFGLIPAFRASRPDLNQDLKDGSKSAGVGRNRSRMGKTLVVAEIALSLGLLIAAGLMIRSFLKLQGVDPGFNPNNVLTLEYRGQRTKYTDAKQQLQYHEQILERVNALPGVVSAGLTAGMPQSGNLMWTNFTLPDRAAPPAGQEPRSQLNRVDRRYFQTMETPVLKGRNFNEQDRLDAPLSAVINQTMARRYWPGEDPIGRRIYLLDSKKEATIIGLVGDVKQFSLDEASTPQIYLAYEQEPYLFATLAVRTTNDAAAFSKAVRDAIWTVDADQPVWKVRTLEFLYQRSLAPQRFQMRLLFLFSMLALILAAIGIYGVMSYAVNQRTQEIGVRLALGARGEDILRLIIGQGMRLALLGAALGVLLSLGATRLMSQLLFDVEPLDPITFTLVPVVLLLVAFLACYLPARRASKVDPVTALR